MEMPVTASSAIETARYLKENRHDRGHVPNYEDVLEVSYRQFLKPGMNVLDIGAHGGRHTDMFREIVGATGRIWAFEPLPHMAAHLRDRFAEAENIHIFEMALSDAVKQTVFKFVSNAPEESGLRERIYNIDDPIIEELTVSVSTGDALLSHVERVDYIKIDVEGGEIDCLKGMSKLLTRHQPFVSVEYGFPSYSKYDNTNMTLWTLAQNLGFGVSDMFGNMVADDAEWRDVCDHAYWDYYLIPNSRRDEWISVFREAKFPEHFSLQPVKD